MYFFEDHVEDSDSDAESRFVEGEADRPQESTCDVQDDSQAAIRPLFSMPGF